MKTKAIALVGIVALGFNAISCDENRADNSK